MKRMLPLLAVLLAFDPEIAGAQGTMSLAYGVCRVPTTLADDFTWPTASPCQSPTNSGSAAYIVSAWKNTATVANFSLTTTAIDILVGYGNDALSDFWTFDPETCHSGGLTSAAQIGPVGGIAVPPNCQNPYGPAATQTDASGIISWPSTGRIHWENDHGRGAPLATLAVPMEPGGYIGNVIILAWDDAARDGSTCAGCSDPACIVLGGVRVYESNGTLAAYIQDVLPGLRSWVTMYGGYPLCPRLWPDPVKNATWGQVKAVYR